MLYRLNSLALVFCIILGTVNFPARILAAQRDPGILLSKDTAIELATIADLTSKKAAKGDLLNLRVTRDILVNGELLIPAGTLGTAQISMVQSKGALGQSGKLEIEALYIRVGDNIVRLIGDVSKSGLAPVLVGLVVVLPGLTGRSAVIPAGTLVHTQVLRDVILPVAVKLAPE
jgi:hypothetical protein